MSTQAPFRWLAFVTGVAALGGFAACSLLSFFFALALVPETKGRRLEDIAASWSAR
jgi:hypothetical protein